MAHRAVSSFLADPGVGQVAQRRIGVGTGDAIGGQTQVQLEATERLFGVSTEDGVAGAVEEPERAQRLLQLKHVVPVEVGHAQIQRAVAQVVGGVHQGRPHLLGHLFARRERRGSEELGQSGGGSVIENAGDGVLGKCPMRARRVCTSSTAAPVSFLLIGSMLLQPVHEPVGHGYEQVAVLRRGNAPANRALAFSVRSSAKVRA